MNDVANLGGTGPGAAKSDLERRIGELSPRQLAALREKLRRQTGTSYAAIERQGEQRDYPLSFHQRRLWFIEQLQPGTPLYNVNRAVLLEGDLNRPALENSLRDLLARHEVLRTTFHSRDGEPVQRIGPVREVPLPVIDLSADCAGPEGLEALLAGPIREEARRPFDFTRDLMLRAALFRTGEQQHVLLLTVHHLACDGWSLRILFDELSELYASHRKARPASLPEVPIRYVDFAAWQRDSRQEARFAERIGWWKEQLADAPPVLELPADRPRPPVTTGAGVFSPIEMPAALREALDALAGRERLTRYVVMLSAFAVLLHRYTGMQRFLLGTVSAGRERPETHAVFGFFVDTVVLKVDLSGNPSLRELMHRIRRTVVAAMEHADVPFDRIVEALDLPRDLSRNGLVQVLFNAPPQYDLAFDGLRARSLDLDPGVARFDLEMTHAERANKRTGITWSSDIFEASTAERMGRHYHELLEQFARDPDRKLTDVSMLTAQERQRILVDWNAAVSEVGEGACVHHLFERQVAATPDATAVVCGAATVTYAQLNAQANRIAHCLLDRGVQPGELVGLCMDRSVELLAGMLGILKAGAAYVPLDPAYPQQRLQAILDDTQLRHVLADADLAPRFGDRVTLTPGDAEGRSHDNPRTTVAAADLAYVIFTSGSTGRPKGVMIEHRALANFLAAAQRIVGLDGSDRLVSVTTISFDIFALELYLPLLHGATVVVASRATAMDGKALARLLDDAGATHLQATPATWRLLVDADWRPARQFTGLCGGELLPQDLAIACAGRCHRFLNWYGPTEATVWATVTEVEPPAYRAGNIGRPLDNYSAYVLDGQGRPLPVGVPGDLLIGGASLARGYFGREDLTGERFFSHPEFGRLYRTGDRARWRDDGTLEFLGRNDDQIKLRGYRIELGDIEAVLSRHPRVASAVVTLVGDGLQQRLAAYLVRRDPAHDTATADIREHVSEWLPDYMRPAHYVFVDRLPLTPNGKIDRRALPPPDGLQRDSDPGYVAPRTDLQRRLATIWAEVLAVPRVGIRDDFFDLGGHSLLVLRLIGRMEKETGAQFQLLDLFRNPTIEALTADEERDPLAESAPLVPIRSRGSLAPFFAVGSHPGYVDVAARVDAERPFYRLDVYALMARRRLAGSPLPRSVEAIAAELLEELLAVQPRGPYMLGGGCEGAPVAFELATMLQARGEVVSKLVLWITPVPGLKGGAFGKSAFFRVARMIRYKLAPAVFEDFNPATLRSVWRHAATEYRIFRNVDLYRPRVSYEGRIAVVRTEQDSFAGAADQTIGWAGVATAGASLARVPGNHDNWLTDHASSFGDLLDDLLAADDG